MNISESQKVNDIVHSHNKALPPPNRYKKNASLVMVNPEQLRVIKAYTQVHRREAAEIELASSPSSSPKQTESVQMDIRFPEDDILF